MDSAKNKLCIWAIIVLLSCLLPAMAGHRYHTFCGDDREWCVEEDGKEVIYLMKGDTLMGGQQYKIVTAKEYDGSYIHETVRYFAAVREENRKVYIVYSGSDQETMLYDFSLGLVNKEIALDDDSRCVVVSSENRIASIAFDLYHEINDEVRQIYERRGVRLKSTDNRSNEHYDALVEELGWQIHAFYTPTQARQLFASSRQTDYCDNASNWATNSISYFNVYFCPENTGDIDFNGIIDIDDVNVIINLMLNRCISDEMDEIEADVLTEHNSSSSCVATTPANGATENK